MSSFEYHAATSLDEALDLLADYGPEAIPVAGGVTFVLLTRQGCLRPKRVVGLRQISELHGVHSTVEGGLEIRACTTHRDVEKSPEAKAYCPALVETFSRVANVRIRNQATVGGNIAYGDPTHDPPPMLLALDAVAIVASRSGERMVPFDEFFVGRFETVLKEDEVLTEIRLPPIKEGLRVRSAAFTPRTAAEDGDYATISVATALRVGSDGVCTEARIGLGGVASVPMRAKGAEDALRGERLTDSIVREAAALAREASDPSDDHLGSAAYKREMVRLWTERSLISLLNGNGPS